MRHYNLLLVAALGLTLAAVSWSASNGPGFRDAAIDTHAIGVDDLPRVAGTACSEHFTGCEGCVLSIGHTGTLAPGTNIVYSANWTGNGACTIQEYDCVPTAPCRLVPDDYLITVENVLPDDIASATFVAGGPPEFLAATIVSGTSFTMSLTVNEEYNLDVPCSISSDTKRTIWLFNIKREGQGYPVDFALTCSQCKEV